ncbi:hypothetical protein HYR54_15640 [Candidatus Acetothermia bacterium]|nr:hypothetical protein [Candidatus Acetothermia bacterium]
MAVQKREKDYTKPLGERSRRRIRLVREGKKIIEYLVQLEVEMQPGAWKPVVRYDNVHGFPHRDQLNEEGEEKKNFMNAIFDILTGYRDVVHQAEQDIEKNWEAYSQRFLEGKWPIK